MKNYLKQILKATYGIVTSRKGQAWIAYTVIITAGAMYMHGDFTAWAGYVTAGLTLFGIGVQHDKVISGQ